MPTCFTLAKAQIWPGVDTHPLRATPTHIAHCSAAYAAASTVRPQENNAAYVCCCQQRPMSAQSRPPLSTLLSPQAGQHHCLRQGKARPRSLKLPSLLAATAAPPLLMLAAAFPCYPSSTSCCRVGRGLVNIMPATIMAGMKPHCTIGCAAVTPTGQQQEGSVRKRGVHFCCVAWCTCIAGCGCRRVDHRLAACCCSGRLACVWPVGLLPPMYE